ncbi:MAG: antirestriction protein ArdA [Asticcacaulis sp.]|uniref:antirestriction protein ArdA n=1 Tax=Asticcacaulis sp. TaxID=1872648 RepID=UPI0039E3673E
MTILHAQPYDISATGFYFKSSEEYADHAARAVNAFGQPVEEFEIQFIDGDGIDCYLFGALGVHQGDVQAFFEAVEEWADDDKIRVIIAVSEVGYRFDLGRDNPSRIDLDLYECDSLRDLAVLFIDDGLFGEIPAAIAHYLDYEAIARDLSMDYAQTTVDGASYIYRCD